MLSTERMTKIAIVGTKDLMKDTIEILHSLKIIHIVDFKEQDETFQIGKPLGEVSRFSELLLSLRSLISTFDIRPQNLKKTYSKRDISRELETEVIQTENQLKVLNVKISKLTSIINEIDRLKSVGDLEEIGLEKNLFKSLNIDRKSVV